MIARIYITRQSDVRVCVNPYHGNVILVFIGKISERRYADRAFSSQGHNFVRFFNI